MRKALVSGLLTSTILAAMVSGAGPAAADPALGGDASAFAATVTLAGSELIPPTPLAEVSAAPFGDSEQTAAPVDVTPVVINGTLIADARVHEDADLTSALEQPAAAQAVAGPYNAQAVGQIEDVEALVEVLGDDVSLLEADAVRAEAVAVCTGDTVEYSASSEVVNLIIGGADPLSGPLNGLVDTISDLFEDAGLDIVADVDVNVVTQDASGASVDALVISALAAIGDPLVQIRLGHAEVSGVTCGDAGTTPECSDGVDNDEDGVSDDEDPGCHTDGDPDNPDSYDPDDDDESDDDIPECSDGVDNDGDGVADIDDPDCHTDGNPGNPDSFDPNDDDEGDGSIPECSDGVDNDGDGVADIDDPQCHTDGNASNPASYDANHDDEGTGATGLPRADGLPRTGAAVPTAAAAALGTAALALLALRRRAAL